jgi:phosphohistidine phosphatase
MKRLLLLRHAKAEPGGRGTEDRTRPLSDRGKSDASHLGRYLVRHRLVPELILVSPSTRTVETAAQTFAEFRKAPEIHRVEALYLAEPAAIASIARRFPRRQDCVCIIGHNPGLEVATSQLARSPVRRKERDFYDAIEEKFPTCALAALDFNVAHWREIAYGGGTLAYFVTPRALAA